MKKIVFSRKVILRAIHAAALALYFAMAAVAHAQTATGDGSGNVTITGSGSTQYVFSPASTPPLVALGTLTIAPGASASSNTTTSSPIYEIQVATVGTTTNSGYVGASNQNNFSGGSAFALTYTPVATVGDVIVQNTATGTITASSYMQNASAVDIQNVSAGSVSITNSGLIQATAATFVGAGDPLILSGVFAQDTSASGSITLVNSGTISTSGDANSGYGAFLTTSGSGGITVTNSGTISVAAPQGEGATSAGLDLDSSGSGNISVNNSGSISSNSNVYATSAGILAQATGNGSVSITSTGTISASNSGYNSSGFGIDVSTAGSGAVTVNNSGPVSASGVNGSSGIAVSSSGTGSISITNNAGGGITSSAGNGTSYGIVVNGTSSNDVTITNAAALFESNANSASGIYVKTVGGNSSVTNSGAMTYGGGGAAYGIDVQGAGAITIMNTAAGTITAPNAGALTGIYAFSSGGAANVTNAAAISGAANGNAFGIDAQGTSTTITNSATISVSAPGFGVAQAIVGVSTSGPLTVHNSGNLTSSSAYYQNYGIFLGTPGTVFNSGNITAGTAAILVQNGSSVTLQGRPIINGTIQGNGISTSTSQLTFALNIASANLAAAKTQLDNEITAYAAQDGGDATFTVDGLVFEISNFDFDGGVIDDLMANEAARVYADTPGYQGIGNAIDNFDTGNPRGAGILAALDNLPDSAVANALAQLSPKALQVFRNIAFDDAGFTAANVNNHLANLRDGLTGFDTSGFSVNAPGVDPMLTEMRSHLLAFNPAPSDGLLSDSSTPLLGVFDPKDTKALVNTQPVDPWSAFISGSVILANLDNTTSTSGDTDYTTGSVLAGVDYRLTEHFTVGALFNYAHTSANLDDSGSKATVDSYSPGIYGSYVDKGWYANALLMYGFNNNTDDRQVTIPGLAGDNHGASDGGQITSGFTGGYEFQRGPFKFGPVVSLQYVHLTVGSFQEEGPTSLSIDRQEADSLRSQIGFEARYSAQSATPVGLMTFTPHVQASWQHEYMDNSDGISSQFNGGAGGGSFIVQGQQPERDSAFLDIGLDAEVAKNVTLFIDYQTQAGQDHFFAQSAQGGVRIGF